MTLTGNVVLVTGASREVGRGTARGLGESGAREIDAAGGWGIPVRCDHPVGDEIAAKVAARLVALAPTFNVPRFSEILKDSGGYRSPSAGEG